MPLAQPIVRLPLFDKLLSLEREGLFLEGMNLNNELTYPTLPHWASPKNCAVLGDTGYEAVHYNILIRDGVIDSRSPVFVTVPHAGIRENANFIAGDSLESFVRFGLIRGFFGIYQLAENRELTLEVYSSPDWQPTKEWHYGVGFVPDEGEKAILRSLGETLNLTPLSYTPTEYQELQDRYLPLLEYWDYEL